MKYNGANKAADMIRQEMARLGHGGKVSVSAELLNDAGTSYQEVYTVLGGRAQNWDVVYQPDSYSFQFLQGCAHTSVLEEYTRLSATRYKTRRTCTRCGALIGEITRIGGESAARRTVTDLQHHVMLIEVLTTGEGDQTYGGTTGGKAGSQQGGALGGESGSTKGGKKGKGKGKGNSSPSQGSGGQQGDGKGGEGQGDEGNSEDGDDDGDGESDEQDGNGEQKNDKQGDGGDAGKDKSEAKTPDKSTMDAFKNEDGEGGEGEGEGEGEEEEDYVTAFKRHWDKALTTEQQATVFHRTTFLKGAAQ